MGLVTYCQSLLRRQQKQRAAEDDLFAPLTFLKHCRSLGAGGMQVPLGNLTTEQAETLQRQAADWGMFVEAIVRLPQDASDISRFDQEMQTAVRAGAKAARTTIIPGRRYEYFDSLEKFREYEQRGRQSLERGVAVAEKHRLPIAVENHKDHRNAERVALFKSIDSEYVGACVDTGNSVALLEDPIETVKLLAPWAHSVHLKDQGVQLYEDGFLLGDIPLGEGYLDLPRMVRILREQRPRVHFSLELITRDPLKVPCLHASYWPTFPELPASDLARTLRQVRAGAAEHLQQISNLTLDEQVGQEAENVRQSLRYAGKELGL
jgi:sugar phosphate isomerase/epimerase